MSKNIIICCDGTGDEYGTHNTNVVHTMEDVLVSENQVACYDPGVGTFNFFGKPRKHGLGIWLGKLFGYGINLNIIDSYKFLMRHYKQGDKVFIFGFSRGAFTARSLAGMLHKCGLLEDGCTNLIPDISKLYSGQNNRELAAGFKKTFCRECKPHFIGVWDTVESLGYFLGKKFPNNILNPDVKYGYQAVAIDEKRKKFNVSLWDEGDESQKLKDQIIEQVWFAGVHSDVGGWYPERGLSDITLKWLLAKAEKAGLALKENWQMKLHPDANGVMHNSRTGFWKLWPPFERKIPEGSLIHQSVLERKKIQKVYNPSNLPNNFKVVE